MQRFQAAMRRMRGMLRVAMQRLQQALYELRRLSGLLALAVVMLWLRSSGLVDMTSPVWVYVHKLALGAIAFIVIHVAFAQAFPYIKQGGLLKDAERTEGLRGEGIFIGVCLLRGLIYGSFIHSVSTGL